MHYTYLLSSRGWRRRRMRGCLRRPSMAASRRSNSVTTSLRRGLCNLSATRFSNRNTAASCGCHNNGDHGNSSHRKKTATTSAAEQYRWLITRYISDKLSLYVLVRVHHTASNPQETAHTQLSLIALTYFIAPCYGQRGYVMVSLPSVCL